VSCHHGGHELLRGGKSSEALTCLNKSMTVESNNATSSPTGKKKNFMETITKHVSPSITSANEWKNHHKQPIYIQ